MVKISVLVAVYNIDEYLEECLQSIVKQTLKPHEVLLVNDGSTDQSRAVCESYANKYPHIKIIDQDNQGRATTRNTGLERATGDYIVFIDGDDYIEENMLSVLAEKAVEHQADMVRCGFFYVYDDRIVNSEDIPGDHLVLKGKEEFFQAMFDKYITSYLWCSIYKKEIFDDIRFEKDRIHEGTFTIPHLFLRCQKIIITSDRLYYYRQRSGSVMNSFIPQRFDIIASDNQLKDILVKNDLYSKFKDEFYLWYGFHLMILIKHMAKYSSYLEYKKNVIKLNDLVSRDIIDNILNAKTENDRMNYAKKSKRVISSFLQNNNVFWAKVKYNSWKKSKNNVNQQV